MSNYTKSTNFTAKDSLPSGDANKVIRGSEFDTEFNALATAVATKSDLAGPTFTGTATFANLTATGTVNFNGATISNLGTITTANLDGGTVDGAVIGGASAAAGSFTTLSASSTFSLGGVAVTSTAAEINILDGVTSNASELNILDGVTSTAAELNILDGVTATAAELNILDGVTSTAAELNILDGVTSTAAELNILDGVTSTAAELNILDGKSFVDEDDLSSNSATGIPSQQSVKAYVDSQTGLGGATLAGLADTTVTSPADGALLFYDTGTSKWIDNAVSGDITIADTGVAAIGSGVIVNADINASAAIDVSKLNGVTATAAELNYTDGVTSNIQTQIDAIDPSPTLSATASGTLANGDAVIVNANGTVSAVAGATATQAVGSPTVFESGNTNYISIAYDSNAQKVLIAYRDQDNSNYGTAVVGTVSGTSISFGTAAVFESAAVTYTGIAYDANAQKFVIAYTDVGNSSNGTAVVATISGTDVTFGTPVVFDSAGTASFSAVAYDANAQKVVIAYKDGATTNGTAVVGTVSGTAISFGAKVVFDSGNCTEESIAYDPDSQKVIIAYKDIGNSNYGTSIVGTVSETSISFGTAVVFESASVLSTATVYDTENNKIVISYSDNGNSNHGTSIVGTVSDTSISFGTAVVFEAAAINADIASSYHTAAGKVVIAYADVGNSTYGTAIVGTVSGTSISFETAAVFESANTGQIFNAYDANAEKVVITYMDNGNSVYGTAVVFQVAFTSTNLTAENYIGISNAAYSDSATATIQIVGSVDDAQSSLTPGQKYFVQVDGSLGTTAADPEVFAGTAVASTKLIVKG